MKEEEYPLFPFCMILLHDGTEHIVDLPVVWKRFSDGDRFNDRREEQFLVADELTRNSFSDNEWDGPLAALHDYPTILQENKIDLGDVKRIFTQFITDEDNK